MFNTLWDNLSGSINNVKLVAVGSTIGLLLYPHICIAGNVASDFLLEKNFHSIIINVKVHSFQVSLPDIGESTVDLMNAIYTIMESHFKGYNLWQVSSQENNYSIAAFQYCVYTSVLDASLFMTLLTTLKKIMLKLQTRYLR